MKVKINGYIKNKTDNSIIEINTFGIKNDNIIKFYSNDIKYSININNTILLELENKEYSNKIEFIINKETKALYKINSLNKNIIILIYTKKLKISEDSILIQYKVIDSDCEYEFKLEVKDHILV